MGTENQLPYLYETQVVWEGQKHGTIEAPDLPILRVATPPEFNGHAGVWTPEHYFIAAVNACFMTTFLAIAEMSKLEFLSFTSKAVGKLEKPEGAGYQMTEVELWPILKVKAEKDLERSKRILEKAEKHCLLSNSIKSQVRLNLASVTVETIEATNLG